MNETNTIGALNLPQSCCCCCRLKWPRSALEPGSHLRNLSEAESITCLSGKIYLFITRGAP